MRGFSYNIINDAEIEPKQQSLIEDVIETLSVSEEIARGLLLKF